MPVLEGFEEGLDVKDLWPAGKLGVELVDVAASGVKHAEEPAVAVVGVSREARQHHHVVHDGLLSAATVVHDTLLHAEGQDAVE